MTNTSRDPNLCGPQFQLFGRPERMYPAWLWLTGLAMENHHFLSSVNHLFRLGPSKNHGELLVITRPGKCRHSWLVISLDLDVKGDTIKNLEKARQMIEKKGHSETAQATSYSYLSYSYLSFFPMEVSFKVHSYFRIVYFVNQGRGDWKTISVAHFDLTKCPKMSHFNKSHT